MGNIDQFFGKYPAMDITSVNNGVPWLSMPNYFQLVQEFLGGYAERKETIDGLDGTSCDSSFHSEMVLNEYL